MTLLSRIHINTYICELVFSVFFSLQFLISLQNKSHMFYIYIIETWSQHNLVFTSSEEQTVLEYSGK